MIRLTLLVILRSILLLAVVFGLYRLVRRTIASFWEGLRGPRPEPPPQAPPDRPRSTIEYRDVHDATFHDERKTS
ncbi:MAG: hypothetical protein AABY75_07835 [Bacteroidota bacterium]